MSTCEIRLDCFPHPDQAAACELDADHDGPEHTGHSPGFPDTLLTWYTSDRRSFVGAHPGRCGVVGKAAGTGQRGPIFAHIPGSGYCVLPANHAGNCAP